MDRLPTGHHGNIFGATFIPGTSDKKVITTSADGDCRIVALDRNASTFRIYRSRQHSSSLKCVFLPGSSSVALVSTEYGRLIRLDIRDPRPGTLLDTQSWEVPLTGLDFDPYHPSTVAVADWRCVKLYDIRRLQDVTVTDAGASEQACMQNWIPAPVLEKTVRHPGRRYGGASDVVFCKSRPVRRPRAVCVLSPAGEHT